MNSQIFLKKEKGWYAPRDIPAKLIDSHMWEVRPVPPSDA
jgi:hypothetical protein